jgi:hypothetical protein
VPLLLNSFKKTKSMKKLLSARGKREDLELGSGADGHGKKRRKQG